MLKSPFLYEEQISSQEFEKLGQLTLRWSHVDHILGNCLKVALRLFDEEAVIMIFPLSLEQRMTKLSDLAAAGELSEEARGLIAELKPILKAMQFVRNNVVHAIFVDYEDGKRALHLRSKRRSIEIEHILSAEELTNYVASVMITLRYAMGVKTPPGGLGPPPLPDRPAIPEFLLKQFQELHQWQKATQPRPHQSSQA